MKKSSILLMISCLILVLGLSGCQSTSDKYAAGKAFAAAFKSITQAYAFEGGKSQDVHEEELNDLKKILDGLNLNQLRGKSVKEVYGSELPPPGFLANIIFTANDKSGCVSFVADGKENRPIIIQVSYDGYKNGEIFEFQDRKMIEQFSICIDFVLNQIYK
jgi:DNA-binding ferritin-like protein (Dps family)